MAKVRENFKRHDPRSPLLLGNLLPSDEVTQGTQKSFLKSSFVQSSLFDSD